MGGGRVGFKNDFSLFLVFSFGSGIRGEGGRHLKFKWTRPSFSEGGHELPIGGWKIERSENSIRSMVEREQSNTENIRRACEPVDHAELARHLTGATEKRKDLSRATERPLRPMRSPRRVDVRRASLRAQLHIRCRLERSANKT